MEMRGRLGFAGGAGGEAEQGHVVARGFDRFEAHRLVERDSVELGVVVGCPVEADHLFQKCAFLGAGDQFVHQPRVAKGERDFRLVDDCLEFAHPQHWHGVDDHRASLGGGEPAGDQRRIVGGADQNPRARPNAIVLRQRVGDAVGPVGELLVSTAPAVADQRDMIGETFIDHAIGQFDRGVEALRIFKACEWKIRPLLRRRQSVPREGVSVSRWSQHVSLPTRHLVAVGG